MKWQHPKIIKVYEALGTIADERLEINKNAGKSYSSSKNKFYTITYDPTFNAIMCNDNSSYFRDTLGYPAIAFLMKKGILEYNEEYGNALKGIKWKDTNQKNKNDFDKTKDQIDQMLKEKEIDLEEFHTYCEKIIEKIKSLNLNMFGKKQLPPEGY